MTQQRIGRYLLEETLGSGGLATVYRARDTKLDRVVALKVLSADANDPDLRRRFQLEARATAFLKHPNIVETYDYSDEDGQMLYLVMQYIPGPNLHQLVEMHGPMTEQTALCIGHELAEAIEFAHEHGIVHRDIKPSNVMFHEATPVLVDFGGIKVTSRLSPLGDGRDPDITRPVGTPGFMAPEQFEGRKVDTRTDIFAVGALLYYLTTGHLPYHGHGDEELYERARRGILRDPRNFQPLLTPAFCYLLADCLAVKPQARLQDAAELRQAIEKLLAAHGIDDPAYELSCYQRDPQNAAHAQAQRTVTTLMRDLRTALLRELQAKKRGRLEQDAARIIRQLHQLTSMESPTGGETNPGAEVLHASRSMRRGMWVLGGFVAAMVMTLGLVVGWLGPEALRIVVRLDEVMERLEATGEQYSLEARASEVDAPPAAHVDLEADPVFSLELSQPMPEASPKTGDAPALEGEPQLGHEPGDAPSSAR